jgi:transcriptional regulator with XRE-family HTH domain
VEDEPDHGADDTNAPPAEVIAGRQLRLLRQRLGWSQQEVADRMKAFGYNWRQSTIGKIEAAQRPLRLNELADLALLFEIPLKALLGFDAASSGWDDPDAVEREISELITVHTQLRERLSYAHSRVQGMQNLLAETQQEEAEAAAGLVRVDARIEVLASRHPRYKALVGGFEGLVDAVIRLRNSEKEAGAGP